MCLAVPARIVEKDGVNAVIEVGGVRRAISLLLCPQVEIGQYALVRAGFAITVIDAEEAQKSLQIFAEYSRLVGEE